MKEKKHSRKREKQIPFAQAVKAIFQPSLNKKRKKPREQIMNMICPDCKKPTDLFKLQDAIWNSIADSSDFLCLECIAKRLKRPVTVADLDKFPWWDAQRPEYYGGIIDGIKNQPNSIAGKSTEGQISEYNLGLNIGKLLAGNSTEAQIAEYLGRCTP